MLKLDNNLLDELGLGSLPEDQKRSMLQHIYETLELRVGTNLANQMTDQQLEEFEKFIDDGGDANQSQALQWLETNLPNYKQVVNDVFEQLKGEIKQMAPQLVASNAQQQAVQGGGAQPGQDPLDQAAPQQPAPDAYQPPMLQAPQAPEQQAPIPSQPAAQSYDGYQQQAAQQYQQPTMPTQPQQPYLAPEPTQPFQPNSKPQQPTPQSDAPQPYQFPTQQPPAGPGAQ